MKVLQVNLDGTGGAYSLLFQISKELYPDYSFDYYWMGQFNPNLDFNELKKVGSEVYEGKLRQNRLVGHIKLPISFYCFVKQHNYKIIHINGDTAFKLLIYAMPAKIAGCHKIIVHSHSSGINGEYKKLKLLTHILCRPFLKICADVFLTCSKKASRWMFPNFCEKAVMIHNGVCLKHFAFSQELRIQYRRTLGITNEETLIGTVGNLTYQKYPEYLVDILEKLPCHYRLILIGDSSNRVNIEKYVKKKNLWSRVIFYGATNKVHEILNALDVFVMTSRFEGLPVSAIEAQANGLPCLLSDKITDEVKILSDCDFASIDDEASTWAEKIERISINEDRVNAVSILKENGFDISDSARKLKEIYSNHWS